MQEFYGIICRSELFDGIKDVQPMLTCLGAKIKEYKKSAYILSAGDEVRALGLLVRGCANIIKETESGERIIVAALKRGEHFGEALAAAAVQSSPVSVVSTEAACVLWLDYSRLLAPCSNICEQHTVLLKNLMQMLSRKNLYLQSRLDILGKRTLREKILAYLRAMPHNSGGKITIPLNREELADYLCAERTALSHELSRMQKSGLIWYKKNEFILR